MCSGCFCDAAAVSVRLLSVPQESCKINEEIETARAEILKDRKEGVSLRIKPVSGESGGGGVCRVVLEGFWSTYTPPDTIKPHTLKLQSHKPYPKHYFLGSRQKPLALKPQSISKPDPRKGAGKGPRGPSLGRAVEGPDGAVQAGAQGLERLLKV